MGEVITVMLHGSPLGGLSLGYYMDALPASIGKSEGLVMPRTEWHGEAFCWGKVQPVHAWKKDSKSTMMMMMIP